MVRFRQSINSSMQGVNRSVYLRSFFLESLWNYPRMQNIGFTYCIYPALRRLGDSGNKFREVVGRQLETANTHPSMSPLFAGLATRLEKDYSTGNPASYRRRVMTTLAAHGDRIFWGTLKPLAAAVGVFGMLCFPESLLGGFLALLIYNAPNLYIRSHGFDWGYNDGLSALERFRSVRAEKRLEYLRLAFSLFLGLITGLLLWQCYQNQFKLHGKFYGILSVLDVALTGVAGFLIIRSGFSVSKITCPVAVASIVAFGFMKYWLRNP